MGSLQRRWGHRTEDSGAIAAMALEQSLHRLWGNRCIGKIKNNAAALLDFSTILLLYLNADKLFKPCPLSLKYPVVFPLEEPVFVFQNLKQLKKNVSHTYI
jgi:hypothetical protein